jgi:hypothetical protein
MPDQRYAHINAIASVKHPKRRECEDCVKIGATWVHLRTCQECGGTRCPTTRQTVTRRNTPARPVIR